MRLNQIEKRLSSVEAQAKMPGCNLFARIKRYEEVYEALDAGLPLDANDPDVKTCLEYEQFFVELERQRAHETH
jgi:hypothetical protein